MQFYEFFAGGGMVRAGLGTDWKCLFANDFDPKKGRAYAQNWGSEELFVSDVRKVKSSELPGTADLIWASFPCQDLSIAGSGAGLQGTRSGTFWPFIDLCKRLKQSGRHPKIIALENVLGTLTSNNGADFEAIIGALVTLGYRPGALVVNASKFVPQSRPRLFVIAVQNGVPFPKFTTGLSTEWHTTALRKTVGNLSKALKDKFVWWDLPSPKKRTLDFIDIVEDEPTSSNWHTPKETLKLLAMMSELNRRKVRSIQVSGVKTVGGLYKRTRLEKGKKVQRAEVRFDSIAGCLRTPGGGSSRQLILMVEGSRIRSRLLSSRETARLMGLPDAYKLPENYNEAYHLTGDGVAVPVVRYLAECIFEPILVGQTSKSQAA